MPHIENEELRFLVSSIFPLDEISYPSSMANSLPFSDNCHVDLSDIVLGVDATNISKRLLRGGICTKNTQSWRLDSVLDRHDEFVTCQVKSIEKIIDSLNYDMDMTSSVCKNVFRLLFGKDWDPTKNSFEMSDAKNLAASIGVKECAFNELLSEVDPEKGLPWNKFRDHLKEMGLKKGIRRGKMWSFLCRCLTAATMGLICKDSGISRLIIELSRGLSLRADVDERKRLESIIARVIAGRGHEMFCKRTSEANAEVFRQITGFNQNLGEVMKKIKDSSESSITEFENQREKIHEDLDSVVKKLTKEVSKVGDLIEELKEVRSKSKFETLISNQIDKFDSSFGRNHLYIAIATIVTLVAILFSFVYS